MIRVREALAGLVLALVFICSPAKAEDNASLYVFAGQSNAQIAFLSRSQAPAYLRAWDEGIKIWNLSTGKFETYRIGTNSIQPTTTREGGGGDTWGPEAQFAYRLRHFRPSEDVYIVKYAVAGTQLAESKAWPDWHPNSDKSELFGQMEAAIGAAKSVLASAGYHPVVRMIFWMQGEADAVNPTLAAAYKENLSEMLAAMRRRWGDQRSVIIVGRISKLWEPGADVVRAAQASVTEKDRLDGWIDTDGYPISGVHFNDRGCIMMGNDIFFSFERIISR